LRSAPAPWNDLVAILPEGSTVQIVDGPTAGGNGNAWYNVTTKGLIGWVDSSYLQQTAAPVAPVGGLTAGKWAAVTDTAGTDGLRLRAAPAPWEQLLATIPEGTKLKILEGPAAGNDGNQWYRVAWGDAWGWVCGVYLAATTAPPTETASAPSNPLPNPAANAGQALVQVAMAQLGKRYVWNTTGPDTFDCSGLTLYSARKALGITLPRTSSEQAWFGVHVDEANLQPGDLVFYQNTYPNSVGVSHVGIYIGGRQFVSAADESLGVVVASLDEPWWKARYAGARRIT
jgi:cell wall-associated NlpC family hydrolase